MKRLVLIALIAALCLAFAPAIASADDMLTILINDVEYVAGSLEEAVKTARDQGTPYKSIKSIEITRGNVKYEDLNFIGYTHFDLRLESFIVADTVDSVADLPEYFMCEDAIIKTVSIVKTTKVGDYAFKSCYALESVNLPDVVEVCSASLYNCTSLRKVNIPNLTTLGPQSFAFTPLESVYFPRIEIIQREAFGRCGALKSVSFPSVTAIDGRAFIQSSLESASFPKATLVGIGAFVYCHSLKSISLPSVKEINRYAFDSCTALTSLSLPAVPPKLIDDRWFYNCPQPRYLTIVDADGEPLKGDALEKAIAVYDADEGEPGDNLWHGWTLGAPTTGVSVDIIPDYLVVGKGAKTNTANLLPWGYKGTASWASADDKVLKVVKSGKKQLIKGVEEGETVLSATFGDGKTRTVPVKVVLKKEAVSSVGGPNAIKLKRGETRPLEPKVKPSDAVDQKLFWKSSDTKIATVENGLITGVGKGTCRVVAVSTSGKRKVIKVTVTKKAVAEVD